MCKKNVNCKNCNTLDTCHEAYFTGTGGSGLHLEANNYREELQDEAADFLNRRLPVVIEQQPA